VVQRKHLHLGVLVGVFIAIEAATSWALWRWQIPRDALENAVAVDERARFVHPKEGWAMSWLRAVKERTPPETVLLVEPTEQPVAVFSQRAQYVMRDRSDEASRSLARPGYAMNSWTVLQWVKGYSPQDTAERGRLLRVLFSINSSDSELQATMTRLAELRRPVAIHFEMPAPSQNWLRDNGIGRSIFDAGSESLWFISVPELANFTPEGTEKH
jgi:hypothetical protein